MPENANINGQLIMTENSGEQSSFSTPFIEEFNDKKFRYYQYFELVIVNNYEELSSDSNSIDFNVLIKNKDYTEIGNKFTKGLNLHFTNNGVECEYTNSESDHSDYGNIVNEELIKNITKNNVSVISFIVYPETLEDDNFKSTFFNDQRCHELSIFINGIKLSKENSNYGFKIPDSLVENYSIGINFNDNEGNFLYQWNFDNSRFIYTDLAYQCYEEIIQKSVANIKYLPIENINIINNYTNYNINKNNYLVLPYIYSNNIENNKFRIEYVVPNLDNLNFMIILGTFKDHEYIINKNDINENNIKDILEEGFILLSNYEKDSIYYLDKEGNINEINTNTNIGNLGFRIIDYYIDEGKLYSIYENKELLDNPEFEEKEYNSSDIQTNDLSFLKNISVLSNELNYYPNLGITTYYNIFKGLEDIRAIYCSSQNMLWKSMFYKYSIYPFNTPLLNNPIFLPYSLNLFSDRLSETMNMYIEFTFGNIDTVTYYIYMGSQYSMINSDNQDIEELEIKNGLVIKFNESSYSLYTYKNGIKNIFVDNKNINSTTVFFKYLCTDDYFTIGIDEDRNKISDKDIFNSIYSIALHAKTDNTTIINYGNITINFGPDNLVYQEEVEDLLEFDNYDKLFITDINSNMEYIKSTIPEDILDRDCTITGELNIDKEELTEEELNDHYTITGDLNVDKSEIDIDDNNYIISGKLDIEREEIEDTSGCIISGTTNIDKEYVSEDILDRDYTITGDLNVDKSEVNINDDNYIISGNVEIDGTEIGDTGYSIEGIVNIDKEELTEEELNDHYTITGDLNVDSNILNKDLISSINIDKSEIDIDDNNYIISGKLDIDNSIIYEDITGSTTTYKQYVSKDVLDRDYTITGDLNINNETFTKDLDSDLNVDKEYTSSDIDSTLELQSIVYHKTNIIKKRQFISMTNLNKDINLVSLEFKDI